MPTVAPLLSEELKRERFFDMLLVRAAFVLALVIIGAVADDGISPRQRCDVIVLPSADDPKIIYYQLRSDTNATHYVWGLQDIPSLFMSVTGPSTTCLTAEEFNKTIDWDKFFCDDNCTDPSCGTEPDSCNSGCNFHALNISGQHGDFAFALTFNSLVEFNDRDSKANKAFNPKNLNMSYIYSNYSLANLKWTFNEDNNQLMTSGRGGLTWYINLNVPTDGGRLDYFPKTLYTINSTTFDFVFQDFPYHFHSDNNASRLVLDITIVHGPLSNGILTSHFSRDDEYTPSIFITHNYLFGKMGTIFQGFLQWKPISYLSKQRKSTKSEQINLVSGGDVDIVPGGLASALFNNCTSRNNTRVFLVMGTEGDDNNANPNYVTWTGMLGYGIVPFDTISLIVVSTIAVGLGIPLLLIIFGSIYVAFKKKVWQKCSKTGYTKMTNEKEDDDDVIKANGGEKVNKDN